MTHATLPIKREETATPLPLLGDQITEGHRAGARQMLKSWNVAEATLVAYRWAEETHDRRWLLVALVLETEHPPLPLIDPFIAEIGEG